MGIRHAFDSTFEKFASSTVIRVFNFIRTSHFLVERIFWIVVLIGFSFGTVWNVTQTIRAFLSEPTASRISFIANTSISGNAMNFPDAQFCLEMRSDILIKIYAPKIDDIIAYLNREADFPLGIKRKLAKIRKVEDERSNDLANVTSNASLPKDAHASIAAYHQFDQSNADVFTKDEVALLGLTTALFMRLVNLELTYAKTSPLNVSSLASIHRAYKLKGTDFGELLALTAELVCVVLQIRLTRLRYEFNSTFRNNFTGYNFCKHSSMVYFGVDLNDDDVICYRSADNSPSSLIFYSGFDQTLLSIHMEALYKEFSTELGKIFIDVGGKYAIDEQPPMVLRLNGKQTVNFTLETVSTSANLRRKGCWDKSYGRAVHIQCTNWCESVEARLFSCNCLSLFSRMVPQFAPLPGGLRSCALSVDEKLETLGDERCRSAMSSFNNCSLKCYDRECESILFASTVQADDPSLAYLNASTVIGIRLTKFVYQKVDEYLTMDALTLVASLGGNLSLYLGASFLALIHIIVFFLKLPFDATCGKKTKATKAGDAPASSIAPENSSRLEETMTLLTNEILGLKLVVSRHGKEMVSIRQHVEVVDRRLQYYCTSATTSTRSSQLNDGVLSQTLTT